jgi:hypothetical protein
MGYLGNLFQQVMVRCCIICLKKKKECSWFIYFNTNDIYEKARKNICLKPYEDNISTDPTNTTLPCPKKSSKLLKAGHLSIGLAMDLGQKFKGERL